MGRRGRERILEEFLKLRQALGDSDALIEENERLRSEASTLRLLLHEISELALCADASLNIIYANRAAVALLAPASSIIGMRLSDFFIEEDRGKVARASQRALRGAAVAIEPRLLSSGNALRLRLRPRFGASNGVSGVLASGGWKAVGNGEPKEPLKELSGLEEILQARTGELIEANEQLLMEMDAAEKAEGLAKELEAAHLKLLDSISDAVLVADAASGRILSANRPASVLLKYPVNEITGIHFTGLHPPETAEECLRAFNGILEKGHVSGIRLPVRDREGHLLPVSISAFTVISDGKTIVYGVFRDLSEAGRREEEKRRINLFMEELYRMILAHRAVRA